MKNLKSCILGLGFITGILISTTGQGILLTQSNETGIYKRGETIEVEVSLQEADPDSLSILIKRDDIHIFREEKLEFRGDPITVTIGQFDRPTSLIIEVRAADHFASIGMVVDPESFSPGTERPKDFDKYWKREKTELQELSMVITALPIENADAGYSCADVEINCTGPMPARGYFAKPESAAPGSLPIVLIVHAAGVKGAWCLSQPETAVRYAKMGKGALCFDLNAHGMLNGQPQEYYDQLEVGELNHYYHKGVECRDDFYFRGMYLRLIRTLDFLTSQPEWDGSRIIVIGESQGGGQALAAAGLDRRVSAVVATVPAMCDWGGTLAGRKGGWPQPFNLQADQHKMMETLPYFDAAHLLKNSKATIVTEIGFIDSTCPPASVYAAINQSKGEKIIFSVPYRGHHLKQTRYQREWEEMVYHPKMKFISDFLQ